MPNYAITVTGSTFDGNTSTPLPNTTFTPRANFQLPGILAVIPGNPDTQGNGANGVNVGLFVGDPLATVPLAGALTWVSNSVLFSFIHANTANTKAAIDDAFEAFDPATNTLSLLVDQRIAPTLQLNEFDKTGGLLGFPSPIRAGSVVLDFSPDNSTVTGTVTFGGGGFIEPTTTAWSATLIGTLMP